jgi:hypothetical protein
MCARAVVNLGVLLVAAITRRGLERLRTRRCATPVMSDSRATTSTEPPRRGYSSMPQAVTPTTWLSWDRSGASPATPASLLRLAEQAPAAPEYGLPHLGQNAFVARRVDTLLRDLTCIADETPRSPEGRTPATTALSLVHMERLHYRRHWRLC